MESNFSLSLENNSQNRCASKRVPRFLEEFYLMLEKGLFTDFIDWNSDGTSILIKDPNQFAEQALPVYFKHNNLASFIRQLNMYDFKKQKHSQYNYAFTHDCFRRAEKGLLKNIMRKSSSEYQRYHEKKKRREDAARMLAQSTTKIQDPDSVFMENNVLKRNQTQMEVEIANLHQQIANYKTTNTDLSEKYESLKQEGVYLINMISALTEKLGSETIFGLIQGQMYGQNDSKVEAQTQVAPRTFPSAETLVNEHGCATAETSSQNFDQILYNDDGKHHRYQDTWEFEGHNKRVKMERGAQPQNMLDQNRRSKVTQQVDEFVGAQNGFNGYQNDRDLLKGFIPEF